MQPYENILIEAGGGLMWVTINRPEHRNVLNNETIAELEHALEAAEADQGVKAIILQGAGEKFFAAGADIKQLHERNMIETLVPGMQGFYKKVEQSSKVTIAAVQGYAIGGGCELALACDIRIATRKTKFGLPELNLGIIPGAGGTQRLSRIVGKGRALDMILTGRIMDGEEAERIGLITYLADEDGLREKAGTVAAEVLKKGPVAIKLAKLAIHKGYDIDLETALLIEKLSQAIVFGTEDKNEGTLAFLEKRTAEFANQ